MIWSNIGLCSSSVDKWIIAPINTWSLGYLKYVLACILALITSLLEPWEVGQYFKKNPKKIFCFLLISRIMNLYVKRTPDIKKVVFFIWR